jgi:sec-independent protein translocase protein TatC
MSILAHLAELRDRLMKAALAIVICFLPLVYFSNELWTLFARPLIASLPKDSHLIATDVAAQFFAPLKLSMVLALFAAMPYVLYQIWAFVAPGLYRHEKRLALPLLASAIALFYLGMAFAYFAVFPVVFGFFAGIQIEGVVYMPDISAYFSFALFMLFAFGIAFEIPVVVLLLVKLGAVTIEALVKSRRYMIVVIFIVAAILTPPDPISQSMMAVPMILLFEAGILAARLLSRSPPKHETVTE